MSRWESSFVKPPFICPTLASFGLRSCRRSSGMRKNKTVAENLSGRGMTISVGSGVYTGIIRNAAVGA